MSRTSTLIREQKAFSFQAKDFDDAQGIVRGYLSTFDNIDDGGDRVRPGAFKRTLSNKYQYKQQHQTAFLFPLLWQHDTSQPIGGYLEAKEDKVGLYVEMQLDLDVQRGKEAYSALKKGYVFQQSIGYEVLDSEYVKVDGTTVRDLKEIRLWEGSIVTIPMNSEAVVTDVKASDILEDDGKARTTHMNRKDFSYHYKEECVEDFLGTDFYNLVCALKGALLDIFTIGDQPESDVVTTILEDGDGPGFISALKAYVQKGVDLGVSDYLNELSQSNGSSYGSPYYMMSRQIEPERKAMTASDATTGGFTSAHVNKLNKAVTKATKSLADHVDDLRAQADEVSTLIGGTDQQNPKGRALPLSAKAGRVFSSSNVQALKSHATALSDMADDHEKSMGRQLKSVQNVADDLAEILQGSESAYGTDPGDAGDRTEGKTSRTPYIRTRTPQNRSSQEDTASDEEIEAALANLKRLKPLTV